MRLELNPNEPIRKFFSRVDSVRAEYLTKCQKKEEDAESLALVQEEFLTYYLPTLELAGIWK